MSLSIDEIKNLARLARIDVADDELAGLAHDFDAILGYIDQIRELSAESVERTPEPIYGIREDVVTYESGAQTDALLANAPAREGNFVKVKKVL